MASGVKPALLLHQLMLFSVVIPAYDRLAFLPRTLESVWAQTFADFEVVVVDDGSTDGTLAYLQSLGGRVSVFRQSNQGAGAARNLGVQRARGDYVAFLDSDDLWFPWTLATFARLIIEHDSPAILCAKVMEFTDDSDLAGVSEEPVQCRVYPDYYASHHGGYAVGSGTAVLRRDEIIKIGEFSTLPINGEDHDLALRLGTAAGFVQVLKPVTLGWRRHSGGATRDLRRSIEGSRYLVMQERAGAYPGGAARARERQEIITRHVRPIAVECLRQGFSTESYELYRATLGWHLRLGRWKYIAAFPLLAAAAAFRQATDERNT